MLVRSFMLRWKQKASHNPYHKHSTVCCGVVSGCSKRGLPSRSPIQLRKTNQTETLFVPIPPNPLEKLDKRYTRVATGTATPTRHTLVIMIGAATTTAGLGLALYVSLQAYQQGGLFAWHPFCMSMGALGLSTATVQAVRSRRTVEGIQSKTQRVQVRHDMRGGSTRYNTSCVSVHLYIGMVVWCSWRGRIALCLLGSNVLIRLEALRQSSTLFLDTSARSVCVRQGGPLPCCSKCPHL